MNFFRYVSVLIPFITSLYTVGSLEATAQHAKGHSTCPSNADFSGALIQAVTEEEAIFGTRFYSLEPGSINNCSGFVGAVVDESRLLPVERNIWGSDYPVDEDGFPHANAQAQFSWLSRNVMFQHEVLDWSTAQERLAQMPDASFIFVENPPDVVSHRGYGGIVHVALLHSTGDAVLLINFASVHKFGTMRESIPDFLSRYTYETGSAVIHVFSYNQENCR